MSELILGAVILALLGFIAYKEREATKEREKFINALVSKNATELRDLELTAKVKPIEPKLPTEPNLVPISDLPDEEFDKMIAKDIA